MKYQLVAPYHSHKVHEASNLKSGSGKCYKELKHSKHILGCNEFSVMDIDNYKIYNFSIHDRQSGGVPPKPTQSAKPSTGDVSILLPDPSPDDRDKTSGSLITKVQPSRQPTLDSIMTKLLDIERKIESIEKKSTRNIDTMIDTKVYDANLNRLQTMKMLEEKDPRDDECVIM
jgi:hypothetical protein